MSTLRVFPLNYEQNLLSRYQSLLDLPGFTLLHSSDKQRGRYDILSACPYDQLKVERGNATLENTFRQLQSMLPPSPAVGSPFPFQGGAIGYLSYDLATQLVGIEDNPHPLLHNLPVIDMQFYDWAIIADHHLKTVNIVAANRHHTTKTLINEIRSRWQQCTSTQKQFNLLTPFTPLVSTTAYQHAFYAIHQDLIRGRAYQVNYTQPFLAEFAGESWEMYKRLCEKNPVPFSAFIRSADADIVSFSPERFLQMDNNRLLTSPIKGSAKRSLDPNEDQNLSSALQNSVKNRAENVMIVDLLRNDLGKIAIPGSVKVTNLCKPERFTAVHHLVSDIEGRCAADVNLTTAFAACFPGGSITGAPKLEAMHIINEHEAYARGVYCGCIAYFSAHGRFDANIAIRTMTAKANMLYLGVGGGIVIDSTWDEELAECYTKINAILHHI